MSTEFTQNMYLSNNNNNAPNCGIQNICQDTLMRKLTCKTLMEILPTEVFLSSSKSYNHNQHDRHFQWVIIYNLDHNHHFRDQLEPVAKSKLQVVGKIQKEMAEKKLTSDFETVPDSYKHTWWLSPPLLDCHVLFLWLINLSMLSSLAQVVGLVVAA